MRGHRRRASGRASGCASRTEENASLEDRHHEAAAEGGAEGGGLLLDADRAPGGA